MNAGIHFNVARPGEVSEPDRMRSFYNFVAHQMFPESEKDQRELVEHWLESPPGGKAHYARFWHTGSEGTDPRKG